MTPVGTAGTRPLDATEIESHYDRRPVSLQSVREARSALPFQRSALRRDLARQDPFAEIVGMSAAMHQVFRLIESAAASSIAVLIEGETGTGKELVARAIHRTSGRAGGPFVAVNCAAVPETLLESQLFGHRKGAFTGAITDHVGLFEAADAGTIFLDEIGDMPLSMQGKLLRVLQEREVVPVGGTRPRRVEVRVISVTNRDLNAEIKWGRFRRDLYYRLAAFPIVLPPLRARRDDIPLLTSHFLIAAATRHRKVIAGIESAALDALVRFDWPGNVRELQNTIERAVALASDGGMIGCPHLSPSLGQEPSVQAPGTFSRPIDTLRSARTAFEARYIADALHQHNGNVSRSAKALGLSRAALHKKIRDYGIK